MITIQNESEQLVALPLVCQWLCLSKSTIYRLIHQGEFPKPIKISAGRVAWCARDLKDWLDGRRVR